MGEPSDTQHSTRSVAGETRRVSLAGSLFSLAFGITIGIGVALGAAYAISGSLNARVVTTLVIAVPLGVLILALTLRRLDRGDRVAFPRCDHCGYNLTGHYQKLQDTALFCPECGKRIASTSIVAAQDLHPVRANLIGRTLVATVAASLLIFVVVCVSPLGSGLWRGQNVPLRIAMVVSILALLVFIVVASLSKFRRHRRRSQAVRHGDLPQ